MWRLFYQPNWEISNLVKRNNHLKRKKDSQEIALPYFVKHSCQKYSIYLKIKTCYLIKRYYLISSHGSYCVKRIS